MSRKEKFSKLEQYDLNELKRTSEIMKKTGKFSIIIFFILFIIIVSSSVISTNNSKNGRFRKSIIKIYSDADIKEISYKTDIFGNGQYIYKLENLPNLEIHGFYENKDIFVEDVSARIYKYFWERWNDSAKDKFKVVEKYMEYQNNVPIERNWILEYETYIEVEDYNEMLEAVETIIRFKQFMGNYSNIIIRSFIKIGDKIILPNNTSPQTYDQIRKSAILQYERKINN